MAQFNAIITGPQGPVGPAGQQGNPGPQGTKGDTGDQGPKGDKGDTGATGAQGTKGDKGDTGATGPAGPTGPSGVTGAQGLKGDSGTVLPTNTVSYSPSYQTWSLPTANVNNTLNIIQLSSHGLTNGTAIIYYTGGGSPIAPLTNGTTYYIRVYDANNVYLYDTAAHAIATGSTTGLRDLGATGTNAQYVTTQGTGVQTEVTFDGTQYQTFVISTTTAGNITANITASLNNNESQEFKFVIPGGATAYSLIATKVNSTNITGPTITIPATVTSVIKVLLVKSSGTYTVYQS